MTGPRRLLAEFPATVRLHADKIETEPAFNGPTQLTVSGRDPAERWPSG